MKRLFSMMLAVMMMLTLCIPAYAASDMPEVEASQDGTITIENATVGETYTIYKLAVLESFSGNNYSYRVVDTWKDFFTTDAAKKYFSVNTSGYLTTTGNTMADENTKKMAEDAKVYIEEYAIRPEADPIVAASTTVVFDNLELGYYFVQSSLGTICSLDTTAKAVKIRDKNSAPTIKKEVQDDNGDAYGEKNDADLFQAMQFRMILDAKKGGRNYVIHDTMENMVFDAASFKVYVGAPLADESNLVAAEGNYTLVNDGYQKTEGASYGYNSFTVTFSDAFCETFTDATHLYIFYQASLTEDAVVGGAGNKNETYLTYGNAQESAHDTTTTYTYSFDMVKTDSSNQYIGGATFTLWTASIDGSRIELVKESETVYRVAKAGDEVVGVIELPDGKAVTIKGLDGRTTYYLQEEAAPAGYNQLTARVAVAIDSANKSYTGDRSLALYESSQGGIQIINRTGTVLPATGGMGTTLFITIGSILVIVAGILLVTKTRMSKLED